MKRLLLVSMCTALVGLVAFSSCGGKSKGQTPADIEMKLWDLVKKADYEKAMAFWIDNTAVDPDDDTTPEQKKEVIKAFAEKMKAGFDQKGGVKEAELLEETISEDQTTAKVKVKLTMGDGSTTEESNKYKKVDGVWKFDNSAK